MGEIEREKERAERCRCDGRAKRRGGESQDGRRRLDRREVTAEGEHVMWRERGREGKTESARFFTWA